MAGAKSTSKAKAAKATDATADQAKEIGASAPVSLVPGAAGDASNGGDHQQIEGGDEGGSGNSSADSGTAALGGGDGAADQAGGPVPGAGDTSASGATDIADSPSAAGAGAGDAVSGSAGHSDGGGGGDDLPVTQAPAPTGQVDSDAGKLAAGDDTAGAQEVVQTIGSALQAGGVGDALLAFLEESKTAQTPAEEAPVAPVTSSGWAMPQITRFPAQITLKNYTASRVVVLGVRIEPYTEQSGGVDESTYVRLEKYLASHARLGGWDNSTGVQVTHDSKN